MIEGQYSLEGTFWVYVAWSIIMLAFILGIRGYFWWMHTECVVCGKTVDFEDYFCSRECEDRDTDMTQHSFDSF